MKMTNQIYLQQKSYIFYDHEEFVVPEQSLLNPKKLLFVIVINFIRF